jgi:hypothetical protein
LKVEKRAEGLKRGARESEIMSRPGDERDTEKQHELEVTVPTNR